MIRNTIPGSTLRHRTYYSTYKGRTRKGIRPLRNEINQATITNTNESVVTKSIIAKENPPTSFSIWWNTSYISMIENNTGIMKYLQPTEMISLYNTINTFINTLNESVISYYHVSFQVFSPDNEFSGNSFMYIITSSALYKTIISLYVSNDKTVITTAPFEKVISYSSLSSNTRDIISTQLTTFLQPLHIENGFQKIFQQISGFEALFHNTI